MGIEIERKFLVACDAWRSEVTSSMPMSQGYLGGGASTIRVRQTADQAFLTIKGKAKNFSRTEFEYPIPTADAAEMLSTMAVGTIVEKIRHFVPAGNGLVWEIDEYLNANAPLFTAEIELPEENTPFEYPAWLGTEVSDDKNYTNRSLSRNPYSTWVDGVPPQNEEI